MQAHIALQGTARPAHYTILKDENGFNANTLEKVLHAMAYVFNRATKAISIVPGAYTADLVAERGRDYLYRTFNESNKRQTFNQNTAPWSSGVHPNLKDLMFYI